MYHDWNFYLLVVFLLIASPGEASSNNLPFSIIGVPDPKSRRDFGNESSSTIFPVSTSVLSVNILMEPRTPGGVVSPRSVSITFPGNCALEKRPDKIIGSKKKGL